MPKCTPYSSSLREDPIYCYGPPRPLLLESRAFYRTQTDPFLIYRTKANGTSAYETYLGSAGYDGVQKIWDTRLCVGGGTSDTTMHRQKWEVGQGRRVQPVRVDPVDLHYDLTLCSFRRPNYLIADTPLEQEVQTSTLLVSPLEVLAMLSLAHVASHGACGQEFDVSSTGMPRSLDFLLSRLPN